MYKDGIKLLAIGNSFSQDAMYYLHDMLCQLGMNESNITLINACSGGCDLYTHAQNAKNDCAAYIKQTFGRHGIVQSSEHPYFLKYLIKSHNWDVITLQQSSASSGKAETYNSDLEYLIRYIREQSPNPAFRFGWHMTWAYCENPCSTHPSFADYSFSQRLMYDRICGAVKSKILSNSEFDFIIPSGTSIQNARLYFGDILNNAEDGFHLNNFGCFVAAATWVKAITGWDIAQLKTTYNTSALGYGILNDDNTLEKIVQGHSKENEISFEK